MKVVASQESPITRARREQQETLERLERAASELLEQVRLAKGRPSPRLLDLVADRTSLDRATVQQALWGLVASGQIVVDDELNPQLPEGQ